MKWLLALLTPVALLLGVAYPVQATTVIEEPPTKLLKITKSKYPKDINVACPKGSDKMFIVTAKISGGSGRFVDGSRGRATLTLKNGKKLRSDDYVVGPDNLRAEYFFFPKHRGTRLDKSVKHRVRVQVADSKAKVKLAKVRRQCVERLEDQEG